MIADQTGQPPRPQPRYRQIAAWLAAIAALLLVFAAYHRPAMVVQMARQLWSCF